MSNSITYKRHPIFEKYFISSDGRVFSTANGWKERKQGVSTRGYKICTLWNNSKDYSRSVHSLVADCFLDYIEGTEINHKDLNKENNDISNLERVSKSYNIRHRNFGRKRFVYKQTTNNTYQIRIKYNGKSLKTPGVYSSKEEAYLYAHKMYTEMFGFEPWSLT